VLPAGSGIGEVRVVPEIGLVAEDFVDPQRAVRQAGYVNAQTSLPSGLIILTH
jgi:hypothetical protein